MKSKIYILAILFALLTAACSSSKDTAVTPTVPNVPSTEYQNLQKGMTKQQVINVLGKDYKTDAMAQTEQNNLETITWNSADPNLVYVIKFVDNKLDRKSVNPVVKENGKNIHLMR